MPAEGPWRYGLTVRGFYFKAGQSPQKRTSTFFRSGRINMMEKRSVAIIGGMRCIVFLVSRAALADQSQPESLAFRWPSLSARGVRIELY